MVAGTESPSGFTPVLAALSTMHSHGQTKDKEEAHQFLNKFQKSVSTDPAGAEQD